jgi:thiazole tautomerase (transcriptional regulator TenI)
LGTAWATGWAQTPSHELGAMTAPDIASHAVPRFSPPHLHVLTDDRVVAHPDFLGRATVLCELAGPTAALHLRTRQLTGGAYLQLARTLMAVSRVTGTLIVINDRLDVALAASVPAIQLGRGSLTPEQVQKLTYRWAPQRLASPLRTGASVHDVAAARAAEAEADWLIAGHVFTTKSHPGQAARGTEFLRDVIGVSSVPVIAVGGITPDRIGEVASAGAYGVALLSGVWNEWTPKHMAIRYLSEVCQRYWPRGR